MEKVVLYYFISSPSLWHWKLTGSAVVGAGGCRANEGWACTLTDGTSVFMYGIPQVILWVPCPIVLPWKKENTTNLPSPAGERDRAEQQTDPSEVPGGFTQGLRGVAEREQYPTARGRGAGGISALFLLSPGEFGAPQSQGGARGPAQDGARRFPSRAVCPPALWQFMLGSRE